MNTGQKTLVGLALAKLPDELQVTPTIITKRIKDFNWHHKPDSNWSEEGFELIFLQGGTGTEVGINVALGQSVNEILDMLQTDVEFVTGLVTVKNIKNSVEITVYT
jgi:hypothetical protein